MADRLKAETLATVEDTNLSRRKYVAALSALASPAVAGCLGGDDGGDGDGDGSGDDGEDPSEIQEGGTLEASINSPILNLDAALGGLWETYAVGHLMHQQLFQMNYDLEIQPFLAEDLELSDDGLTWTITLHEGVEFHPPYQREMLAEDVIYNFDRITSPDVASPRADELQIFDEWSVVDDYTFEMVLGEQNYAAQGWLGYLGVSILSPDLLEEEGDAQENMSATGPFKFEEWVPNDHIRMTKFEDYWEDGLPHVDEVIARPITEPSQRITGLETGSVPLLRNPPKNQIGQLQDRDDITVEVVDSGGLRYMQTNPFDEPTAGRGENQPTQYLEVRQAINESLNRPDLLEFVDAGFGTPTQTWFPESSPWHTDYAPYTMESNHERAEELIAETPLDPPVEIVIVSSSEDDTLRGIGQVVYSQLSEGPWNPQLDELPIGQWSGRFGNGEFDLVADYLVTYPNPDILRKTYDEEGWGNVALPYDMPEAFDLWDQAKSTQDTEERKQLYDDLQRILVDLALEIPLHTRDRVEAYRNFVKGYEAHPYQVGWSQSMKHAWLDR